MLSRNTYLIKNYLLDTFFVYMFIDVYSYFTNKNKQTKPKKKKMKKIK